MKVPTCLVRYLFRAKHACAYMLDTYPAYLDQGRIRSCIHCIRSRNGGCSMYCISLYLDGRRIHGRYIVLYSRYIVSNM